MSKKVTMKAKKVTKSVTKKAQPKKKVVAKKVANVKKNVASAKKAVAKVIKKQVAKRVATKVVAKKVAKKAVAKKKPTKVTLKEKYTKLYKVVSNYSESLMQDVYSVVYRTKELKRFVNENLANKYIEQEVLVRLNEHAITTAKKSRAVAKELASEFE
jgi:hypothetical protein